MQAAAITIVSQHSHQELPLKLLKYIFTCQYDRPKLKCHSRTALRCEISVPAVSGLEDGSAQVLAGSTGVGSLGLQAAAWGVGRRQ